MFASEQLAVAWSDWVLVLASASQMLLGKVVHTTHLQTGYKTKKNDLPQKIVLVGLPGFEPRMTGPESVVLPLHHSPLFVFDGAKVEHFF